MGTFSRVAQQRKFDKLSIGQQIEWKKVGSNEDKYEVVENARKLTGHNENVGKPGKRGGVEGRASNGNNFDVKIAGEIRL